jgi:hypothetical protein
MGPVAAAQVKARRGALLIVLEASAVFGRLSICCLSAITDL